MNLSDRMVEYEQVTQSRLIRRQPVVIRLDGKAFHTFTKELDKPFDLDLSIVFEYVCYKLKEQIQGTKFIYSQSDEISLLLTDWDKINTDCWFDYRIQKMTSISASLATMYFNEYIEQIKLKYMKHPNLNIDKAKLWNSKMFRGMFDSRVFNLPLNEVVNYFIYRQKDAKRNSIQATGQAYYSHNQLNRKSLEDIKYMLKNEKNIDWDILSSRQRIGFCLFKDDETLEWVIDENIPDFVENKNYIEKYLKI